MKLVEDLISILQHHSTSFCFFPTPFCFNKAKNIVLSGMELMGKSHGKPQIESRKELKSQRGGSRGSDGTLGIKKYFW